MKRKLTMMLLGMMMAVTAFAQSAISGTVVSASDGEPVIGAAVKVKGSAQGVVTDLNGKFTINVTAGKTLVFSYVGLKTKEASAKNNMRVVLEADDAVLDEVMVVAYGTQKKSSFTGSATVVGSDEICKVQTSNALEALNGKVTGVQMINASGQPGSVAPTIRIRGISSINAGNSPLYVVDGAPYDGDINAINPSDIESMTVLKDAASNALYGARGANGVIMITTKRAAQGVTRVNVDAKWGANSRASQRYNTINSPAQYYETYYTSLKNRALSDGMSEADAHTWAVNNLTASNDYGLGYNVYSVPEGQSLVGTNGRLNPYATMGNIVSYNGQEYLLQADDWYDETYKTSLRQEYNATVTASTNKSNFYTSFGYLNNKGIVNYTDYERLSFRLKADYQIKPWLKVGGNLAYTKTASNYSDEDGSSNSSGNIFAFATQIAPIYPLYIRDGRGNKMIDAYGNVMCDYGDGGNAGLERPEYPGTNAFSDLALNVSKDDVNMLNGTGFFEIRFLNDFKFTSTNSVYWRDDRTTNMTNAYYGSYASSNGILNKYAYRYHTYNLQQILDWNHSFGKHNVTAMVGHEYYSYLYNYLYASKSNMFSSDNLELAGAVKDGSMNSYAVDRYTEGFFGRAMYDFDGKYFGQFSFRRDASSRFSKDHRWGNFWSAGASWIITKENFMESTKSWLDMLKFKASYGSQGNDNIDDFLFANTYSISNSSGHPAAKANGYKGNDDITWEKQGNFNIGVEFEMFHGRLNGQVEYFYRKTSDMLYSFSLPASMGYTSYYDNIGDMRNSGIEIELKGDVIRTKDFTWGLNANFTAYKNKVTYLDDLKKTKTVDNYSGYESGSMFIAEGLPLYTWYIPQYAGVDKETGESLWYKDEYDSDGNKTGNRVTTNTYSEADDYLCGTSLPDVYGGFGTTLSYKGLDLSIDFVYQIGGKTMDYDYMSLMQCPTTSFKGQAMHADLLNAWSPTNTSSSIPRLQFGDEYTSSTSDRFLTSASYLSLQNINLGYTLPEKWVKSTMKMEKIRIYVTGDNLWLWSKRQGLDPRQSVSGTGSTGSYYSPMRTISGGITLTF